MASLKIDLIIIWLVLVTNSEKFYPFSPILANVVKFMERHVVVFLKTVYRFYFISTLFFPVQYKLFQLIVLRTWSFSLSTYSSCKYFRTAVLGQAKSLLQSGFGFTAELVSDIERKSARNRSRLSSARRPSFLTLMLHLDYCV